MSVYIRSGAKDGVYSYDFEFGGRRFSGSTGKTARREALQFVKSRREEERANARAEREAYGPALTIGAAVARYWQEVGEHHKNSRTTMWSLAWLARHFGDDKPLAAIGDPEVAAMVAKRRGEVVPSRSKVKAKKKERAEPRRIGAATVNRTATQPLRAVLLRARNVWKVKTGDVRWRDHLLSEPKERVREASPGEESAVMAELSPGYDVAVQFAFLSGCRRMEVLGLEWSRVDFFGRQFTVIGKGDKPRVIPMSQAIFALLWAERDRHPDKVFTYVARRTVKMKGDRKIVRGQRYPLTEAGMKSAFRRAVPEAGVKNFHFHDTRHTAATRVLRKSNLRVVQQLLGHEDIATTTKYAHAVAEDIRAALEAASPTQSPTPNLTAVNNELKAKGKAR